MVRARCFSLVLLGLAVQSWGLPSKLYTREWSDLLARNVLGGNQRNGSHS